MLMPNIQALGLTLRVACEPSHVGRVAYSQLEMLAQHERSAIFIIAANVPRVTIWRSLAELRRDTTETVRRAASFEWTITAAWRFGTTLQVRVDWKRVGSRFIRCSD